MTIRHRQLIENTHRLGLNLAGIIAGVECLESEDKIYCDEILHTLRHAKVLINNSNEFLKTAQPKELI